MPYRPKTPCNHFQCPRLINPGERYCEEHKTENNRAVKHRRTDKAEQRFYKSREWRQLRQVVLAEQPLCERCMATGRVTAATVVHHRQAIRDSGDRLPTVDELEALCISCHSKEHGGWK